jgi:hypothetical protein
VDSNGRVTELIESSIGAEFLAVNPEVPGSISGDTTFSE